ncbi:translation initiation factor eIF4e [Dentipellis sp. KUC8613]|nr:translation initiation factor eIF4e [Dentipellis sp. KUC8613]
MAGYFSNHSAPQSRFLANKDSASTTTTTTTATTTSTTPSMASRPRIPSKHFSTSLSGDERASAKDRPASAAPGGAPSVHPLRNTWVFWFRQQRAPGNKNVNYEEGIKKISSFASVESFWSLWTHLHPPSALLPTTDYLLFHSGVRRPVWEDPLNLTGGKWIIRLRKGVADRIWEDLVLAIVGDMFAECGASPDDATGKADDAESWRSGPRAKEGREPAPPGEEWPEICGCTISVRQNEDIVSIWNRVEADMKVRERIKETIRRVLSLPPQTIMEYKSNNASLQHVETQDKSRNNGRTSLS